MKRNRFLCMVLLCAILLTGLSHTALAKNETSVDPNRFMCETISAEGATVSRTFSGSVSVSFRGATPILFAALSPSAEAVQGNAIRIVLKNDSYCNLLHVTYRQNGVLLEQQIAIERRSGKQDCFVYVQNPESITELQIALLGGTNGTVELYGIGIVSVYDDSGEKPGEITECAYRAESKTVTVSGNIKHEIVSGTRDASVALYVFGLNDRVDKKLLEQASPIARAPFSVRFEFSVPAISFSERFMQYVVAIVDSGDRVLHWYTPSVPSIESDAKAVSPSFKGVSTAHGSFAVSADAGLAVIDVYLDQMQSEKNNGLLHAKDGVYFYIDRSYIYELDETIEQYSKDGCQVYLRFLLSGGSEYNILHGSTPSTVEAVYNGISLSGDTARLTLYAYTDFLCHRYAEAGKGKIHGIVLGRAVDLASTYNYVGNKTLAEYTEIYATALHIISEATKQREVPIDLVVPMSDVYDWDGSAAGRRGEYPTRLFLVSLCKMIKDRFGDAFSVRVLLEGKTLPKLLSKETVEETRVSADNLAEWEATLQLLSRRYPSLYEKYLYYWQPDGKLSPEELSRAYVYTYYKLSMGTAAGFILAPDENESVETLRSLFETVKYVNTQLGKSRNQEILFEIGAISWEELIPGIDENALIERNVYISKTYSIPAFLVHGSYVMWDYQQGRSVYDWFASTDCSSLYVKDVDGMGRALVATVTGEEACSEVIYSYSADEIMGVVDMLSIDIMVLGEPGSRYNLTFEVCGDSSSCVVNAEVESGKKETVYISTLRLDKNDRIKNIRLFSVPVSGVSEAYQLCVEQLSAHSTSLSDEALEKAILSARLSSITEGTEPSEKPEKKATQLTAGLIILILFVSAVIVFTLAKRNDE